VSPEATELLKNIKEKIAIIAVAGEYRTGKSFLLNRIILNKTDKSGFGVGPTINPCTKVRRLLQTHLNLKLGSLDLETSQLNLRDKEKHPLKPSLLIVKVLGLSTKTRIMIQEYSF